MGLAHMFLFLYKHNPMCSIYTRDLFYSFFFFNKNNEYLRINFQHKGNLIFKNSGHTLGKMIKIIVTLKP